MEKYPPGFFEICLIYSCFVGRLFYWTQQFQKKKSGRKNIIPELMSNGILKLSGRTFFFQLLLFLDKKCEMKLKIAWLYINFLMKLSYIITIKRLGQYKRVVKFATILVVQRFSSGCYKQMTFICLGKILNTLNCSPSRPSLKWLIQRRLLPKILRFPAQIYSSTHGGVNRYVKISSLVSMHTKTNTIITKITLAVSRAVWCLDSMTRT